MHIHFKHCPSAIALALLILAGASAARAATFTWDASGNVTGGSANDGSGTWSTTGTNWDSGGVDSPWTSGNNAVIGNNNGAAGTITVGTISVANITFNPPGSGSYTLSSGTITLNTSTITTNAAGATIGSVLAGSTGLTVSGTGALTLTGANTYTGTTLISGGNLIEDLTNRTGTINPLGTFSIASSGTLTLNNINGTIDGTLIDNTSYSGAGTIIKTGTGYLDANFSGSSFSGFTGTINVLAGTLATNNGAMSIPSAKLNIASGANFDLRTGSLAIDQLTGSGTFGTTFTSAPTLSVGNNNGSSTFGGTITNGILGQGGSAVALTKNGAGTFTLAGSNTYTGATTVNGGTLKLDFSAVTSPTSNIISTSSVLTLAGGQLLVNGGSTVANAQQFNVTTLPGSTTSTVALITNATPQNLVLNLGAITRNLGSVIDFTEPSGVLSTTNGILTSSGTASNVLNSGGVAYATVNGGSDWAAKDAGNAYIVPLSSIGGYTLSSSASLSGNADIASGVTTTTLSGSNNITTLRFNQPQATTINIGGGTLVIGGILVTGSVANNLSTITSGTLEGPAGKDLVILQNNPSNSLVIGATIVDNASATGLTAAGPGTLTLAGANTYTGNTVIDAGASLQIGNGASGSISNSGAISVSAAGTLAFDEVTSSTQSNTIANSGTVVGAEGAGIVNTLSGGISGTGGFTQSGAGETSLSGANSYSGLTSITSGTLQLDLSGRSGTINLPSTNSIGSAGTLVINSNSTFVIENTNSTNVVISGSGTLDKTGAGDFELFGGSASIKNFTGQINILNGILGSNGSDWGSSAGLMNVNISSGAYLDIRTGTVVINQLAGAGTIGSSFQAGSALSVGNNNGSSTFSGAIVNNLSISGASPGGSLAFTKNGTGTLTFTGSNTYTGTTTINAGTLQIGNGSTGSIANGSAITTGSLGTIVFDEVTSSTQSNTIADSGTIVGAEGAGIVNTLNGALSGTGVFVQSGAGMTTLSGAGIGFTGGATVTGGTLAWDWTAKNNIGSVYNLIANINSGATLQLINTQGSVSVGNAILVTNGALSGAGTVNQTGGGDFDFWSGSTLSGFTGTYNILNGILSIQGSTGAADIATGAIINVASGAYLDLRTQNLSIDQLTGSGNVGSSYYPTTLTVGNANGSSTFSGLIADQGIPGGTNNGQVLWLTKTGTGTLILTGSDTYTGATTINQGILQIGNGGAAGSLAAGTSITGSSGGTLVFDLSSTETIGNAIGGAINLTQAGSGTLIVTSALSNTGTNTINAGGTLQVGNGGTTGALGTGNTVDNGNLVYNYSSSSGPLMGNAGQTITGSGSISGSAGSLDFLSNMNVGGSLSFIQTGTSGALYTGLQVGYGLSTVGLTGSSITMYGDLGYYHNNGGAMTMDTSAYNGPVNLNISLGRPGVWYNLTSFTVNSGTGTVSILGTGVASSGWNSTPVTITAGVINDSVPVSSNVAVTLNPSAASTLSGPFSGSMSLTDGGTGTLTLTGSNSYSGNTVINGGATLQVGNGSTGSIANGSAITVSSTGTLAFDEVTSSTQSNTISNSGMIVGAEGAGIINTLSGAISGTGGFTQSGAGETSLSAANSYSGTTSVTSGTLQLDLSGRSGQLSMPSVNSVGSAGTLVINSNSSFSIESDYSSNVVVAGSGTLIKTGSGDFEFWNGGSIKNFTGQINVLNGILGANGSDWGSSAGLMNLYIASGAYLDLRTGNVIINQLTGSGTAGSSYNQGDVLSVGNNNGSATFAGSIINSLSFIPSSTAGGQLSFVKNGTGTQTLTGSNTYTGSTTINAGTLTINGAGVLGGGSYGGSIVNNGTLNFASSASQTLTAAVTGSGLTQIGDGVNPTTVTDSGGFAAIRGTLTIANGSTLNMSGGNNLLPRNTANGGNNGSVVVDGTLSIGSGIAETIDSTGGIALNNGTLTTPAGNTTFGAFFIYANETFNLTGSNTISGSDVIGMGNGSTLTLNTVNAADSLLVSGQIINTSNGGIAKSGAGTVTLSGSNSYTGATTINAGTLQIGNGGTTGSIASTSGVTGSAGATLAFNFSTSGTFNKSTSGGINVTQAGSGTLTLAGSALNYSGTTSVTKGTLIVAGSISGNAVVTGGTFGTTGGSDTIGQNLTVGNGLGAAASSVLDPSVGGGASTTVLNVTGNVTLNSDAAFVFALNSGALGFSDGLAVSGTLTLAGALLQGQDIGNTALAAGVDQIAIASYGTLNGTFAGLPEGGLINIGQNWFSIDYGNINPDEITLTSSAIPEPGTWGTVFVGFVMLIGLQRRRRSKLP